MMFPPVTRRTFLACSAGAVAAFPIVANAATAQTDDPLGTVCGVVGLRGLGPGTATNPATGEVILTDGRTLVASQTTRRRIGPGKAVMLAPEPDGRWGVVYAER